jgi:hypothetical protein
LASRVRSFSDMLRLWSKARFKEFHFTLEEEADGS